MMPRLDGWMTASLLRRNPETSTIKVVLITARAQEDDKTRGKQIGVDAYLTKPFDPSEMIRVVRELAGHPPVADSAPGPARPRAQNRPGARAARKPARNRHRPGRAEQPRPLVRVELGRQRVTPKPSSLANPANRDRGSARASALATVGRAPSNAAVTKPV